GKDAYRIGQRSGHDRIPPSKAVGKPAACERRHQSASAVAGDHCANFPERKSTRREKICKERIHERSKPIDEGPGNEHPVRARKRAKIAIKGWAVCCAHG